MDLGTTVFVIYGLICIGKKKPLLYPNIKPYALPLAGLAAVALAGLIQYLPDLEAFRSLLEFRWIVEVWFFVLILCQLKNWSSLFKFMIVALGITSLLAIVFYFAGYNPVFILKGSPSDGNLAEARLGGFMGHSMPFAHTYSMALLVTAGFFLINRKSLSKAWQVISGLALLLAFFALIFSYARGIWLAGIVTVICTIIVTKNKSLLKAALAGAILAAITFATVPALQGRVSSTIQDKVNGDQQRKVLYKANWLIFKDHPAIGIGYGYNRIRLREYYDKMNIPADFFESHAHNQYVHWLSGTGLIGLLFYLWFVLFLLWQNYRTLLTVTNPTENGILLGTLMAQICFLVGGLTEANFSIAKNRTMYLFIIAIFLAIKFQTDKNKLKEAEPSGDILK